MDKKTNIFIYQGKNGEIQIQIDRDKDTVWARQDEIAELFDVDRTVATKHINNTIKSGEVDKKSNVQFLHIPNSDKPVKFYSLDIILAVGYRTNSANAIKFRQWATTKLKEYLVAGYSINQSRLDELGKTIRLLTEKGKKIDTDEAKGLLDIIASYTESFVLLNQYDSGSLGARGSEDITYIIGYADAKPAIDSLRSTLLEKSEATPLFGNEKDTSFVGILSSIVATFD